jgi:hypothetical protein
MIYCYSMYNLIVIFQMPFKTIQNNYSFYCFIVYYQRIFRNEALTQHIWHQFATTFTTMYNIGYNSNICILFEDFKNCNNVKFVLAFFLVCLHDTNMTVWEKCVGLFKYFFLKSVSKIDNITYSIKTFFGSRLTKVVSRL